MDTMISRSIFRRAGVPIAGRMHNHSPVTDAPAALHHAKELS
jgi:hypothetical protein